MPSWNEIHEELNDDGSHLDIKRRKYLNELHNYTSRNIIVYYSGWLQFKSNGGFSNDLSINDEDKNGFMTTIHGLDKSLGLDLLLHTPGGEVAATESIIEYLRDMFDGDIRAIIPQLAMSGGTMISLSAKEILMGKQSSLGPVDPQLNGLPAHGILEEFDKAVAAAKADPNSIPFWQLIINKYHPTLIGESEKAIEWAEEIVRESLKAVMFKNDANPDAKIDAIITELVDHGLSKSHNRHFSLKKLQDMGLNITSLEDDNDLQDAVLSVHHCCMHTFNSGRTIKLIENHNGATFVKNITTR